MTGMRAFGRASTFVVAAIVSTTILAVWAGSQAPRGSEKETEGSRGDPAGTQKWVLDDFSARTAWKTGSGTAKDAKAAFREHEGRKCLHLTGSIPNDKTARLQVQRSLYSRRRPTDASAYQGVRLTARGNGQTYAVHLRTRSARFPGQYYRAEFKTNGQWQEITLPFRDFKPVSVSRPMDASALMSIALVCVGEGADSKGSEADLYVDEIGFYREPGMYRELTPEEARVIVHKGTERPFTGKYNDHFEKGVYTCRRCGAELYESESKFRSHCGWPSFDDEIPGAVRRQRDADGVRVEILCNNCGGHLGHVFRGEGLTPKNVRHCVNSISMDFISAEQRSASRGLAEAKAGEDKATEPKTERALFASGCFWGTEYHFQRAPGVISTTVGYTGGHVENPTYRQVCTGRTGHAETTEVIYDPTKITYEQLARLFFETHNFTQLNRQGPDIGPQYRSAIFYLNEEQKQTAEKLIGVLREKGFDVKTEVTKAGEFYAGEQYHQDYYNKTGKTPYCHVYRKIF